jgi:prepilin-type N-terminal cleavage/methylation domain-containing protein/prepilin-type processing-associated H-X9-DG protein
MRRNRGFTLIELLVVVAIIALLLSILLPTLGRAREQAKRAKCASRLKNVVTAMYMYGSENRDQLPLHRGTEPNYVLVKASPTYIPEPAGQWHLGEKLMPYMKLDPPQRNSSGAFDETSLERSIKDSRMFYCPNTGLPETAGPSYPTWHQPSVSGSFMDFAQFWNFVGPQAIVLGPRVLAQTPQGMYRLYDDDQVEIEPDGNPVPGQMYRLPHQIGNLDHIRVPRSNAEIPVLGEFLVTWIGSAGEINKDAVEDGELRPMLGNHPGWTGHQRNAGINVSGGNFSYIDGHVEWRTKEDVKPRLLIDRTFYGNDRRLYWW